MWIHPNYYRLHFVIGSKSNENGYNTYDSPGNNHLNVDGVQGHQWNKIKVTATIDQVSLHINDIDMGFLSNNNRPQLPEVKVYAGDSFYVPANAKIRSLVFTPITEQPSTFPSNSPSFSSYPSNFPSESRQPTTSVEPSPVPSTTEPSTAPFFINFDGVGGNNKDMQCAIIDNAGSILSTEDSDSSTLAKFQRDITINVSKEIKIGLTKYCLGSKLSKLEVISSELLLSSDLTSFDLHFASSSPSMMPSDKPSLTPSSPPSNDPSDEPSNVPSRTKVPSVSEIPSDEPSFIPSSKPSSKPSRTPSANPSLKSSHNPSHVPSDVPSDLPSGLPSSLPSSYPSSKPSMPPSSKPIAPSADPSLKASSKPSHVPSSMISHSPSDVPFDQLSSNPSIMSGLKPSYTLSFMPSMTSDSAPSPKPSNLPVSIPTSPLPTDVQSTVPSSSSTQPPAQSLKPFDSSASPSYCMNDNEKSFLIMFMANNRSMNRNKITLLIKRKWGWKKIAKIQKILNNKLFIRNICLKKNHCYKFVIKNRRSQGLPKGSWYDLYWEGTK